jgi:hypothetical protein
MVKRRIAKRYSTAGKLDRIPSRKYPQRAIHIHYSIFGANKQRGIIMENLKTVNQEQLKERQATKNLIEDLKSNLEKADFMLSNWMEEYSFSEKPDPYKAIAWGTNQDKDMHAKQSAKWFWEYNRIHSIIEIAMDYITRSLKLINEEKGAD